MKTVMNVSRKSLAPPPKAVHQKQQQPQRRVNVSIDSDEPQSNFNGLYKLSYILKTVLEKSAEITQQVRKNLSPPPPLLRYPFIQNYKIEQTADANEVFHHTKKSKVSSAGGVFLCPPCGTLISSKDNYVSQMLQEHGTVVSVASGKVKSHKPLKTETSIRKTVASPPALQRTSSLRRKLTSSQ
ncbi:unnamed protein product [Orchesella dallaii]|uniref:Uncharacterized protein n=1 Tax=Orchesella dallaii TaxID=48710 RepID=A0ABP1Q9N2_9HEXA